MRHEHCVALFGEYFLELLLLHVWVGRAQVHFARKCSVKPTARRPQPMTCAHVPEPHSRAVWKSFTPPSCISYANVRNYYNPYAHCSLDKGVAGAQHIQLLAHTCARMV